MDKMKPSKNRRIFIVYSFVSQCHFGGSRRFPKNFNHLPCKGTDALSRSNDSSKIQRIGSSDAEGSFRRFPANRAPQIHGFGVSELFSNEDAYKTGASDI